MHEFCEEIRILLSTLSMLPLARLVHRMHLRSRTLPVMQRAPQSIVIGSYNPWFLGRNTITALELHGASIKAGLVELVVFTEFDHTWLVPVRTSSGPSHGQLHGGKQDRSEIEIRGDRRKQQPYDTDARRKRKRSPGGRARREP